MQIISAKRETDDGLLRGTSLGRSTFLSRDERSALEGAVVSPRSINAHVELVREGERTDNLFLIIKGWACRYTTTREGGRQFSAILLPGDLCNLDSLLFDRLDCGVRTLMPATIVALPRESALALAAQHSGIARTFTWLAFVENATRQALADAMERVAILARCRSTLYRDRQLSLEGALRQVCEALHAQAEPRSIRVFLTVAEEVDGLSSTEVTTLALVVNELATNAIKHAYEEGASGHIEITLGRNAGQDVTIIVDDDGLPFPDSKYAAADGLGLGLSKRLMASISGLFIMPSSGAKAFELRLPIRHV